MSLPNLALVLAESWAWNWSRSKSLNRTLAWTWFWLCPWSSSLHWTLTWISTWDLNPEPVLDLNLSLDVVLIFTMALVLDQISRCSHVTLRDIVQNI